MEPPSSPPTPEPEADAQARGRAPRLGGEARVLNALLVVALGLVSGHWLWSLQQPLVDGYSFRQCQTAMTARWFDVSRPLESFFAPQTPELGAPWVIPFEAPTYQGIVAALEALSGWDLVACGRLVSALFMLGSLALLARCFGAFEELRPARSRSLLLLTLSPIYVYWSRTFMIETAAVFGGVALVAAALELGRGVTWLRAALCVAAGLFCVLTKATTFPSFGLAAALACAALAWRRGELPWRAPSVWVLVAILVVCVVAGFAWTAHGDAWKRQSVIAKHLTSERLASWNWGTPGERVSWELWGDVILTEALTQSVGSPFALLLIGAGLVVGRRSERLAMGAAVALFLLPMLLFPRLHIVHAYYQTANALWVVLALGLAMTALRRRLGSLISAILLVIILGFNAQAYRVHFTPLLAAESPSLLEVGALLRARTAPEDVVVIVGDEWHPRVAFYAERRAILIPSWSGKLTGAEEAEFCEVVRSPERLSGGRRVSAVIVNSALLPEFLACGEERSRALEALLQERASWERREIGTYLVLTVPAPND